MHLKDGFGSDDGCKVNTEPPVIYWYPSAGIRLVKIEAVPSSSQISIVGSFNISFHFVGPFQAAFGSLIFTIHSPNKMLQYVNSIKKKSIAPLLYLFQFVNNVILSLHSS